MMHGMGGGIGATMIMGWPLSDWVVIMLLLIVSVMIVAFVSAVLSLLQPGPDRAIRRNPVQKQAPPGPKVPPQ